MYKRQVLGLADSGPANARTGVSAVSGRGKGADAVEIGLETVGSGSGLLDLTRDSDETALGAELMDQVYSNDAGGSNAGQSGIFAAAAMKTPEAQAPISTGMMVAAVAALVVAALIIVTAGMGSGSLVASNFAGNLIAWAGALAGIVAVFGLLGFFIGRATE